MGAGPQTGGVADVYCNVQYPLMSMPCQELHSDKRIFLVLRALGAVMLQSKRHSGPNPLPQLDPPDGRRCPFCPARWPVGASHTRWVSSHKFPTYPRTHVASPAGTWELSNEKSEQ